MSFFSSDESPENRYDPNIAVAIGLDWSRNRARCPVRESTVSPRPWTLIFCVCFALLAPGLFGSWIAARAQEETSDLLTPELARQVVDEVLPEVERLRGLEFLRPVPVTVIDDERARDYILRRLEEFDQIERTAVLQEVYAQLGLIDDGVDLLEIMLEAMKEQVAGFYDPGDGSFYLLDDQPAATTAVLTAHELTHALEDQYFDLDARLEAVIDDDDRMFAIGAVHEGSATLLMMVYMMQAAAGGAGSGALGNAGAAQIEQLEALPPVLLRQLLGPYVLGMHFLTEGNFLLLGKGFPAERIDEVFGDLPTSSEQILHPEKYWREGSRDEPVEVSLEGAAESLGDGWERRGDGVLGELTLGLLVGAPTPSAAYVAGGAFDPAGWTNEAATGWCGDRWELWRRGDESVVLWLSRWDTTKDAVEFAAALPDRESQRSKRKGAAVAIVTGDTGRRSSRLLSRMLGGTSRVGCSPPAKAVE